MAPRGRKPKPTAAKRRLGNPGGRPLNDAEPSLEAKAPDPPPELNADARAEWDRLAPMLAGAGVLTEADRAVLTTYCVAWSFFLATVRKLDENGLVEISEKGGLYMSPYMSAHLAAAKQMNAAASELGLTPSARSRIKITPPEAPSGKARFFNE